MSYILHFSLFCGILGEEGEEGEIPHVCECIDCSKQVATSVSYLGPSVQATEKHACDIEVVNDVITTLTGVKCQNASSS